MQGRRLRWISIRHGKIDANNQIKVDAGLHIIIKSDLFFNTDIEELILKVYQ